jgi:RNA polymerase sigma factor (sigma-70 family)
VNDAAMVLESEAVSDEATRFGEFFSATYPDVYRMVLVVAHDPTVAEDATATAYLRAWEHWRDVAHHPAPIAWVARVAMNDALSWWRRVRRLTSLQPATGVPSGIHDLDLVAAIAALPLRQRQVISLRIVLGLDEANTALVLGVAPGTVGVHLHRALAACRRRLSEDPTQTGQREVTKDG